MPTAQRRKLCYQVLQCLAVPRPGGRQKVDVYRNGPWVGKAHRPEKVVVELPDGRIALALWAEKGHLHRLHVAWAGEAKEVDA
jgi:hypothetical protein